MDNIVENIITEASKPVAEQYGKAIVIAIAGTTASILAKHAWDAAVTAIHNRAT